MCCLNKDGFTPAVYGASAGVVMSWGSFFLDHYLSTVVHTVPSAGYFQTPMFPYTHRASFRVHLGFVGMFSPNISKMSEQRFQYFESMSQRIKAVPNAKRGLILVVAMCKRCQCMNITHKIIFILFF